MAMAKISLYCILKSRETLNVSHHQKYCVSKPDIQEDIVHNFCLYSLLNENMLTLVAVRIKFMLIMRRFPEFDN